MKSILQEQYHQHHRYCHNHYLYRNHHLHHHHHLYYHLDHYHYYQIILLLRLLLLHYFILHHLLRLLLRIFQLMINNYKNMISLLFFWFSTFIFIFWEFHHHMARFLENFKNGSMSQWVNASMGQWMENICPPICRLWFLGGAAFNPTLKIFLYMK